MTVHHLDERPLFVTIPQAAAIIGVSAQTGWRAVNAGKWPTLKICGRRMVPRKFCDDLVAQAYVAWAPDGAA